MSISFTKKVNTEFLRAIDDFGMLSIGGDGAKTILLGYSGGADSSALLHLFKGYIENNRLNFRIVCVHVNHMIRGIEADLDCSFCEKYARELGVEFISRKINVPELSSKQGIGLEEAARNARYDIFNEISRETGASLIATAHNSSDNLETVLFNLTRGTGLNGLCGIPPVRGNIIRPLIYCSKSDILEYCKENSISYVTDSTNCDTAYTRNYIRSVIVPQLGKINSDVEGAVGRMCTSLRKDKELLDSLSSDKLLPQKIQELCRLDESVLARVLQKSYVFSGGCGSLEYDRVCEIIQLIKTCDKTKVSLHGKIDFVINDGVAYFEKHKITASVEYKYKLKLGINDIPEDSSVIFISESAEPSDDEKNIIKSLKNVYKLSIHNILYFDKITKDVFARSRTNGDKIRMNNMTKSVKKLLQSSRLSIDERRSVPFICDESDILLIPSVGRSDKVSKNDTQHLLNIWYFKDKKGLK